MPNDIPDWTSQHNVALVGGVSNTFLGDTATASPAADSATDTITTGPLVGGNSACLASFKPSGTVAQVGNLGALLAGSASSVTPAFGQATAAGHLLVAWVTANATGAITTVTAGWVQAVLRQDGFAQAAIWYKPNSAGADAAPTFTVTGAGGSIPMRAQLGEFSGVATSSPVDQTGSGQSLNSSVATVSAGTRDGQFGDLVLFASYWSLQSTAAATFAAVLNNGTTAIDAGNSGGISSVAHSDFVYGIVPLPTTIQPLGVADWAYDSTGTSAPASGSQASVVLAATPGKTYTCAMLAASIESATATAAGVDAQILDGASVIFNQLLGDTAAIGAAAHVELVGLALKGTAGNSMTARISAGVANIVERVNVGAYLR